MNKLSEILADMPIDDALIGEQLVRQPLPRSARERALQKAGFAPAETYTPRTGQSAGAKERTPAGRRVRPLLRALVIAAVLLCTFATALATTDLAAYLENRFGYDLGFLSRIRIVSESGTAIGASATDQGITATLEAAYTGEGGTLLLVALTDAQGRLGETSALYGTFEKGGYGSYSTQTTFKQDDGTLYVLIDIRTGEKVQGARKRYVIHKLAAKTGTIGPLHTGIPVAQHARRHDSAQIVDEPDMPVPVHSEEPLHLPIRALNGLALTDVYYSDEGLMLHARYDPPADDPDVHSIQLGLTGPDGVTIFGDFATFGSRVDGSEVFTTAGFTQFKDAASLEGYTLSVSYAEQRGIIEGAWAFDFRLRSDGERTRIPIGQIVESGDGLVRARIDEAIVTRGTVIVTAKRLSEQLREQITSDFSWYNQPRGLAFELLRGGQPATGVGVDAGMDAYREQDEMRAVLTFEGEADGLALRVYDGDTNATLLEVPLG